MTTSFSGFGTQPHSFTAWGYDEFADKGPRRGESLLSQYDFRLHARDPNGFIPCTWVDQDKSGDFDPKSRRPPPPPPTKRKRDRPVPNGYSLFGQVSKKPKTTTWQSGRYTGQNGLVTFKVGSDHSRAVLQAIGNSTDNWPHEPQSQPGTDSTDLDYLFSTARNTSDTSLTSFTSTQHDLRKRQSERNDPYSTDLEHVTLGHPSARGCLPCLSLHLPCSLLQEGSSYPCLSCRQDSMECELVLPPTRKAACESCKRRRVVCSYRAEGGDHTRPCVQCESVGIKCVAGPSTGRTRTGPSLDMDALGRGKLLVKPPRQIASCVQCREGKRWCSFRGRKDKEPPCKGCRDLQIVCTKETPAQTKPLNTSSLLKGHAPTGLTKPIMTRLAHPVTFNYISPTPAASTTLPSEIPCHWCTDPLYGLLGLGILSVEVLDTQDGSGYTEVAGGHTAQGHLPSRICPECTLDRLLIVGCGGHELASLEGGWKGEEAEEAAWMEYLMPENEGRAPFEWCAVCPTPASYRCCKPDDGEFGGACKDGEDVEVGCGLRLCENCAITLVHECDGDLTTLIRKLKKEDADGLGLRADAEFLLPEGELLRQICIA